MFYTQARVTSCYFTHYSKVAMHFDIPTIKRGTLKEPSVKYKDDPAGCACADNVSL